MCITYAILMYMYVWCTDVRLCVYFARNITMVCMHGVLGQRRDAAVANMYTVEIWNKCVCIVHKRAYVVRARDALIRYECNTEKHIFWQWVGFKETAAFRFAICTPVQGIICFVACDIFYCCTAVCCTNWTRSSTKEHPKMTHKKL